MEKPKDKSKKFSIGAKVLSAINTLPMTGFVYGVTMLVVGNWFLPQYVVGCGIATAGLTVGTLVLAKKAEKLKKEAEANEQKVRDEKMAEMVAEKMKQKAITKEEDGKSTSKVNQKPMAKNDSQKSNDNEMGM